MKKRWILYSLIILTTIFLSACGGSESPTVAQSTGEEATQEVLPTEDTPDIQDIDPATIFADRCARCHKADRSGDRGPALLPETLTQDTAVYQGIIQDGSGIMPSFNSKLSSDEINALVEFIFSDPQ